MQTQEPSVRASVLVGYEAFLSRRGIRLGPLLEQHGLSEINLQDPENELSLNSVSGVLEAAARSAKDPCLGIAWAEAFPLGGAGVIGYLFMNSPTVREALRVMVHYAEVFMKPVEARFEEMPGESGILFWHYPVALEPPRAQYASFMMACLLLRLRSVAGANWQPISVEVEYRDLGCPELVRRVFGPKITYNARRNAIQVDARTLDREIASSDARLHMLMRALGDRLLEECLTEPNDIVARTRKEIASRLEMGEVTLESIADRLKTAPRTLQTRLSQADATFEGILNDTRRALAVHYLRDTDLLMTEIAFLLGFSELSAFTRAAQRWFGTPPSTYRQQMRKITNGASSNHLH